MFGEVQPTQYQRADRVLDEDEQRELEQQKYKYVIGQQCKISFLLLSWNIHFWFFLVSLQEKLGSGVVEPRSLEDEGIFVGKKPVVPTNLVHRAEKRILQECTVDNKVNERTSGEIF